MKGTAPVRRNTKLTKTSAELRRSAGMMTSTRKGPGVAMVTTRMRTRTIQPSLGRT